MLTDMFQITYEDDLKQTDISVDSSFRFFKEHDNFSIVSVIWQKEVGVHSERDYECQKYKRLFSALIVDRN